jgi:type IV fimbrial biogenesis protein FimT
LSRKLSPGQIGFTLVELMIVLAVATILLLIALPSFADMIDRARLRGAAGDAVSLVADARGGSVQRNRNVVVSFGGTSPAWCIGANGAGEPGTVGNPIPAAAACTCTTPSGCMVGTQQLAMSSSNYSGVTVDTNSASLTFDSRLGTVSGLTSTLTTTGATFTSPKGKYKLLLTVAPLGQPSLCVPSGSPAIPGYASC